MHVVRAENILGRLRRMDHHRTDTAELHLHHRAIPPRDGLEVAVRPAADLEEVAQHRQLPRGPRRGRGRCRIHHPAIAVTLEEEEVDKRKEEEEHRS